MRLFSYKSAGWVLLLGLCSGCVGGSSPEGSATLAGGGSASSRSTSAWSSSANDNLSRQLGGSKSRESDKSFYDGVKAQFAKVTGALTPKPKTIKAPQPTSLLSKTGRVTPDLLVSTAKAHAAAGDHEKAAKIYRQVLKKDPSHLAALLGYGHLLDWQNDLLTATAQYRKATRYHPKSATAHNDLGLCYARRRMFGESAASLRRAVRLQPDKKLYQNNLATVLVQTGRSDEALSHLIKVHGPAVAHYNVGFLLTKTGDMQRAKFHFSEALRADPSLDAARQWLLRLGANQRSAQPAAVRTAAPTKQAAVPAKRPLASRLPTVTAPVPGPASDFLRRDVAVDRGPSMRIPAPLTAPDTSRDAAVAPSPDDPRPTSSLVEPLPPIAASH